MSAPVRVRAIDDGEPSLPLRVVASGPSDPILVVTRGPSIPVRGATALSAGQPYRGRFSRSGGSGGSGGSGTIVQRIASSAHDIARFSEGVLLATSLRAYVSGYLNAVYGYINGGYHFPNTGLPQGVTIVAAKITFISDNAYISTSVNARIRAEDSDNPSPVFVDAADYDGRPRTTAYVDWNNIGSWVQLQPYDTPDLSPIVQEAVDRPGFSGTLQFFTEDTGSSPAVANYRAGSSYDDDPNRATILTVEYTS